jgi:hypothetical protein
MTDVLFMNSIRTYAKTIRDLLRANPATPETGLAPTFQQLVTALLPLLPAVPQLIVSPEFNQPGVGRPDIALKKQGQPARAFIELKAPTKSADPERWKDAHDKEERMTTVGFKPLLEREFLKDALAYEFANRQTPSGNDKLRIRLSNWPNRRVKRETQSESALTQQFFVEKRGYRTDGSGAASLRPPFQIEHRGCRSKLSLKLTNEFQA